LPDSIPRAPIIEGHHQILMMMKYWRQFKKFPITKQEGFGLHTINQKQ